jgi:hypothetical protein
MIPLLLSGMLAQADTGEQDACATHAGQVDATYEEGICISDDLASWCALYFEGPCLSWSAFLQQLSDTGWTLTSCTPDSELGYRALYIHSTYSAVFDFNKEGNMIGMQYMEWIGESYPYCCEGKLASGFQRGEQGGLCVPLPEDTAPEADSTPPEGDSPHLESVADPRCGCTQGLGIRVCLLFFLPLFLRLPRHSHPIDQP